MSGRTANIRQTFPEWLCSRTPVQTPVYDSCALDWQIKAISPCCLRQTEATLSSHSTLSILFSLSSLRASASHFIFSHRLIFSLPSRHSDLFPKLFAVSIFNYKVFWVGGLRCVRAGGNHNVVIHVTSKGRKRKGGSNWVRGRCKHLCCCQRVMSTSVVESLFGCLSVCASICLFACLSRWLEKELTMLCAAFLKIFHKLWSLGKDNLTETVKKKEKFFTVIMLIIC